MPDYSKMAAHELNAAIFERKWDEGTCDRYGEPPGHDYLSDDGATWRALVEMPLPCVCQRNLSDGWVATYFDVHAKPDEPFYPTIRGANPNRVVWIAWMQWKEAQHD